MEFLRTIVLEVRPLVPLLAVTATVLAVLLGARWLFERRYGRIPAARFRTQLIMLGLTLAGLLAMVLALPVSDTLRGQLLSLIGILLSATIALSSTTFLGNALAGILLRVVKSFRMGDFIRVGEHFGRASERGLFHVEIQTEDRDLTTLPNLFLVTHPVRVVRESGTIVSATVSLGYDVPRRRVEELLLRAAAAVGLQEPFVHILELGDFSVSYRVAGLLTEVKQLLSTQSALHGAMLDELHDAAIEIVSPNFMNTRAIPEQLRFIPAVAARAEESAAAGEPAVEAVVFDKADEAEHLEGSAEEHQAVVVEVRELERALAAAGDAGQRRQLERRLRDARARQEGLERVLEEAAERPEGGG